jgi:hypothetical protein
MYLVTSVHQLQPHTILNMYLDQCPPVAATHYPAIVPNRVHMHNS